jgi:hypothetical protein
MIFYNVSLNNIEKGPKGTTLQSWQCKLCFYTFNPSHKPYHGLGVLFNDGRQHQEMVIVGKLGI